MNRTAILLSAALCAPAASLAAESSGTVPGQAGQPTHHLPVVDPNQPSGMPLTKEELAKRRALERERDLGKRLSDALAAFAAKSRPSVPLEDRLLALRDFLRAVRPLSAENAFQSPLLRAVSEVYGRSPEPELRDALVDGLVSLKPRDGIAFLGREAESAANAPDRIRAIRALQKWKDAKALPFLHMVLRDPDPNVLQTALDVLAAYADPSSVPPCIDALQIVQARRIHEPLPGEAPYPIDAVEAQILTLLQKISGEEIEADPGKWRKWWLEKGQGMRPKTDTAPKRVQPGEDPERGAPPGRRSRPKPPDKTGSADEQVDRDLKAIFSTP